MSANTITATALRTRRAASSRRFAATVATLTIIVVGLWAASLMIGQTLYSPAQVLQVLAGDDVRGATFTIGRLRLPRATTAVACGVAFGIAGATFQTLLRNVLASPDVIGITAGANTAATAGIILLGASGLPLAGMAIIGGLVTAAVILALAGRGERAGARLILIGIGVGSMLMAATSWLLLRGNQWDVQAAMRWMTGSLNGASWDRLMPLIACLAVGIPAMIALSKGLDALRLGEDTAKGLGVPTDATRLWIVVVAVLMLATATSVTGPIAFVSFLAGPITVRLIGAGRSPLLPAGLVGAALVLAADLLAQNALPVNYPVGVVTGALGGPFLLWLLIRTNSKGGAL